MAFTHLSTRLHPNESVNQSISGVSGWTSAKACPDDVAPVAPGLLLGGLDTITS